MDKSAWINVCMVATHRYLDDHESAVTTLAEALWIDFRDVDPDTVARGNWEARTTP